MRLAGYGDADIGAIIGHSRSTTTAGYGGLTQFGPKERKVMIERVRYEGLDLKHLYPSLSPGRIIVNNS